jgi:imidazoleglycerol phosphate dehydratase HisB
MTTPSTRSSTRSRTTKETSVRVWLDLDGTGSSTVSTGIGFLDHMLDALAKHARIDLELKCEGDLHVDDHHVAEDCALVLGAALDEALGDRRGVTRFGSAYAPLDEALARAVVDLSGRPWAEVHVPYRRESIGGLATENIGHVFRSLGTAARMSMHIDLIRGENDHHKAEAAFKAFALALRQAINLDGSLGIPSTKGSL